MAETSKERGGVSLLNKLSAIYRAGHFRPSYTIGIIGLSVAAALLEGVGLSFILPIIELTQGGDLQNAGGYLALLIDLFQYVGIPFSLGYMIASVTAIMTLRYSLSFLVGWLRAAIEAQYIRYLQTRIFSKILDAETTYFDQKGSDEILNMIVTQADYAGRVIRKLVAFFEKFLLSVIYFLIALLIAPLLTLVTVAFLGGLILLFKFGLTNAYSIGTEVVQAKEQIQTSAQAGTQGIREIKLFGMKSEVFSSFSGAIDKFVDMHTKIHRNRQIIENFYQLSIVVALFILVFVALEFLSLSFGALGVFLFAIFRLGPTVSNLNQQMYDIDGDLPHLVQSQQFIDELDRQREPDTDTEDVPTVLNIISFDDVEFAYETTDEKVLDGVSFSAQRGEFVAFVGPSGAGKSTVAALAARLYSPDSGQVTANGTPIKKFDIEAWRARVSIVHQQPYIFNTTLRENVTIGNRDASLKEIDRVCDIARVTEFIDNLPDGYDTHLGDDGVRLSGGQRQRVAIARALLKDSDLLILDEATSDLDTSLERQIHSNIEAMERDYMMIVIAHRLSTVTDADRIYALKDGKIAEAGTHENLLKENGVYSQLYTVQSS